MNNEKILKLKLALLEYQNEILNNELDELKKKNHFLLFKATIAPDAEYILDNPNDKDRFHIDIITICIKEMQKQSHYNISEYLNILRELDILNYFDDSVFGNK
jgi:hypothetical protein